MKKIDWSIFFGHLLIVLIGTKNIEMWLFFILLIRWMLIMYAPLISSHPPLRRWWVLRFRRSLGPWQHDSCVLMYLRWGMYMWVSFSYFYFRSCHQPLVLLRVVNGPGRANPTHFYLGHGHNRLGIKVY